MLGERVAFDQAEAVHAHQRLGFFGRVVDVDSGAVTECSAAFTGVEEFVGGGEVGEADDDVVVGFKADQDAPSAGAADEVAGTVDGVDDPAATVRGFAGGTFFTEQAVFGECGGEFGNDESFSGFIGHRHRGFVGLRFNADVAFADLEGELAGQSGNPGPDFNFFFVCHGR